MDIYLARHGQTVENLNGILQGHLQGQLTALGQEQAQKLGMRLKDEHFDAIYSSDLQRCVQTLAEIAPYHTYTEPVLDPRIREKCGGELEGQKIGIAEELAEDQGVDIRVYRPPGGESWEDTQARAYQFYRVLCQSHSESNGKVLVISHGGWIKEFINAIRRSRNEDIGPKTRVGNTAIYVVRVTHTEQSIIPAIVLENDTSHLDPVC